MSTTNSIPKLINYLNSLPKSERQHCVKLILCRTRCCFEVTVKFSKLRFTNKVTTPSMIKSRKYEMFTILLEQIKINNGLFTNMLRYQLLSDCDTQEDFDEFIYHIFKTPPSDLFISRLLYQYKKTFQDDTFDNVLQLQQFPINVNGSTNEEVIACNRTKTLFFTNFHPEHGISVVNSINKIKILNNLRKFINVNFVVNSVAKNKQSVDTFIKKRDPLTPSLFVQVYSGCIINIINGV